MRGSPNHRTHQFNMKELLTTDSPKYLKRLVRELNGQVNGFYASFPCFRIRCNRARLENGVLKVRSPSSDPMWFEPLNLDFVDCYSNDIVASRKDS
jgi:hypothetical protein